ncbi:MAG: phosphate acyltransferase, partial [Pseudomonadota bacterium]
TFMLDVGANASCDTEHLYQFAVMGSVVAANLLEKTAPTVGLLNIGTEAGKGHDEIREADERLANSPLNYVGFVEGNALFNPVADVIVTDGFTGNVALKTIEGTATMVGHILKTEFTRSWLSKLQGLLAQGVLRRAAAQLDPRTYNGASLVGVDGVVIKSHGSSDAVAFATAIDTALLELADNVPAAIRRGLTNEAA